MEWVAVSFSKETYIHVCVYIYMCVCVCVCMYMWYILSCSLLFVCVL